MLNYIIESDSSVIDVDVRHHMSLKDIFIIQNYR